MTNHYRVEVTEGAEADLEEIYDSIARNYSPDAADAFAKDFEQVINSLEQFPARGSVPNELSGFAGPIRQMPVSSYRAVYRIGGDVVFILFVAHERQRLQSIVAKRAIRP